MKISRHIGIGDTETHTDRPRSEAEPRRTRIAPLVGPNYTAPSGAVLSLGVKGFIRILLEIRPL